MSLQKMIMKEIATCPFPVRRPLISLLAELMSLGLESCALRHQHKSLSGFAHVALSRGMLGLQIFVRAEYTHVLLRHSAQVYTSVDEYASRNSSSQHPEHSSSALLSRGPLLARRCPTFLRNVVVTVMNHHVPCPQRRLCSRPTLCLQVRRGEHHARCKRALARGAGAVNDHTTVSSGSKAA